MDRTFKRQHHYLSSVRAVGIEPLKSLLRGKGAQSTESAANAIDRRAIHATTVFRLAEDYRLAPQARTPGKSQASRTADAGDGSPSNLSKASTFSTCTRSSNLSVLASRCKNYASEPSLEHRHHLHPTGAWIRLFGCNYGLVQPLRAGVGSLNYIGHKLLRFSLGMGASRRRPTGDLQYRPRLAIHQCSVHRAAYQSFDPDQHGRKRPRSGQCLCRAALALGQVRRSLFERLRGCRNRCSTAKGVFRFLQPRAAASVARVSDARRSLPGRDQATMTDRGVRPGRQSSNRASMSFPRYREIYQSDEINLRGRNLVKVTPSLIVLMSLRLVIPGGLLSSIARFRFTNRQQSATRRGRIQVDSCELIRDTGSGLCAAPIIRCDLSP